MTELLLEITNVEMQSIAKQVYQYDKGMRTVKNFNLTLFYEKNCLNLSCVWSFLIYKFYTVPANSYRRIINDINCK